MARAKTHDRHLGIKTQIWTTRAEVALWKRAAEGEGMTLSGWLRWVAHRASGQAEREVGLPGNL